MIVIFNKFFILPVLSLETGDAMILRYISWNMRLRAKHRCLHFWSHIFSHQWFDHSFGIWFSFMKWTLANLKSLI